MPTASTPETVLSQNISSYRVAIACDSAQALGVSQRSTRKSNTQNTFQRLSKKDIIIERFVGYHYFF